MSEFDLRELGWTPDLAENLEPGLEPGRVAAAHRGAFDVWMEAGEVRLSLPGKLLRSAVAMICWRRPSSLIAWSRVRTSPRVRRPWRCICRAR